MLATCPHCHNAVDVGDGSAVMLCEYCGREFHPAATPVIAAMPESALPEPAPAEYAPPESAPRPQYRLQISPEERATLGPRAHVATAAASATHSPFATLTWSVGILVLVGALLVQYAYFMREDLARHSALRPWLETLCTYAQCEIPLLRDPARVRIAGRDIRRHPETEGALRVMLTLENEAAHVQAYPIIQLSFFDVRDRLLARRRFTPQEYLSVTVNPALGMPVRQPVQTMIDIVDPGPDAVNFEFLLR
ncbi:MAG: DUF3426 domain-containing protein [Gammaproteobacteria bacterium]|nr:DUF3426 domain-containing protein [Gammaproteobacteria bacterium]